jgi:hypothetical protein
MVITDKVIAMIIFLSMVVFLVFTREPFDPSLSCDSRRALSFAAVNKY